ncbi:hypothetical protein QNI16_00675 [Cytophagaceae bacterium YF14B1]|uniref:Uncharacterized protein n=1 Tax=Xanthocytophaga flava TaxID=3048013 RepID=A0AAE3QLJ7_9BACT|nr:hypothetical protein [Xanthocytophaga flavus]MDJ1478974.1 hypothetical protein [Xanthocytophaga flavus]
MRFLVIVSLILALSQGVVSNAQTLHIKVLDSFNHKPIEGVELAGIEKAYTGKNGEADVNLYDDEQIRFIKGDYYPLFLQASVENFDNPYEIELFLVHKATTSVTDLPAAIRKQNMTGYLEFEYVFSDDSTTNSKLHLWVYDDMNGFAQRTSPSIKGSGIVQISWQSDYTVAHDIAPPVHLTKFVEDGKKCIYTSF